MKRLCVFYMAVRELDWIYKICIPEFHFMVSTGDTTNPINLLGESLVWTSQFNNGSWADLLYTTEPCREMVGVEGSWDSLKKVGQGECWAESQPRLLWLPMFAKILVLDLWVACLYSPPSCQNYPWHLITLHIPFILPSFFFFLS